MAAGGFLWAWGEDEIWRYREDEWSFYAAAPDNLNDIAYISDMLLAAVYSKLQYFDGDEWQELSKLDWDAWRSEVDEKSGILWVPTSENLYRWNGEEMSDVGYPPSLGFVGEIAVTGDGTVWAGGLNGYIPWLGGLARFDDATGSWEVVRPWRADEDVPV
jgi:bacillopeptidase F (M6 metalloprotease family)